MGGSFRVDCLLGQLLTNCVCNHCKVRNLSIHNAQATRRSEQAVIFLKASKVLPLLAIVGAAL